MKSWIRTGLLAVLIYLTIFLFNYLFVRKVSGEILMLIVTAPVYVLLQLFGIVNPGIYFIVGILFYFFLGIFIDFLAEVILFVYNKIPNNPLGAIFK